MATRHERVVIDLDDRFSRPAAGMAAGVSLFRRNLDDADGSLIKFDRHTQDVGRNIDKLSGRLGLFIDLAATLGPALIPATTALVPLLAGLTNQLGFAVIAGGSAVLAFGGVGDALKAVNEQAINPSTANLEKMHEAMAKLGPAGRDFVRELQTLRPELQKLQTAAQAGLFPGMTEGIESLMTRMPQVETLIGTVSDTLGDLLADAGESLAGPQWDEFFAMLQSEARPTLQALGESIGQVTKGLAELWIAFAPMNREFSQGMLDASRDFADWADGLSQTQGFADFMAYLDETGPKVAEALGAIGSALLDVLKAAAPIGGPALEAITAFSKAVSGIASSDLGKPLLAGIALWRAYSLAVGLATRAQASFSASSLAGAVGGGAKGGIFAGYTSSLLGVTSAQERAQTAAGKTTAKIVEQRRAFAQGAAGALLLADSMTGASEKIGLTNTATGALVGTMIAPGVGTAIGATAGAVLDLAHANDGLNDSLAQLSAMAGKVDLGTFNAQLEKAKKQVDDLKNVTGVGDLLSDTAKAIGGAVKDPGSTFTGRKGAAEQSLADAAATQKRVAAYKQLSGVVTSAATSLALARQGFALTDAGARESAMGIDQFTFAMRGAHAALGRQGNWDSFRMSVLDAKDAVAEAGKTLQRNGDIIRGQGRDMQRAGLESRGLLRNIAQGALATSEGMKNIGARTKFLEGARKSFIQVAHAMGLGLPAARALADQLGLLDRTFKPNIREEGAAASAKRVKGLRDQIDGLKNKIVQAKEKGASESSARVRALRAAIAALRDRVVYITAVRRNAGVAVGGTGGTRGKTVDAYGSIHYAYGDVANRHQPELAGPGPTRIWREPETMGEAYIPLADDDRRPRARAIAAETVSLLGGTAYFADGGLSFARGGRNDGDGGVSHAARAHAEALRASTKAINREKNARERLVGKRDDLSGSVRDTFMTDPFGETNVWAAGGGSPLAILKADIAKANAFKHQLAVLKKQGLDGDALAAIAATGDIGKATALASMGKAGVGQYESLYKQRASAAASVGKYAGQTAYGPQITVLTKHISAMQRDIKGIRTEAGGHAKSTGDHVGKHINKVSGNAKRGKRG